MKFITTDDEIYDFYQSMQPLDDDYFLNPDRTVIKINLEKEIYDAEDNNLAYLVGYYSGYVNNRNIKISDIVGLLVDAVNNAEVNGDERKSNSLEIQKSAILYQISSLISVSRQKIFEDKF